MKKSNLFKAVIAVIAALLCVTCDDNSGRSPGEDDDANSFANKFIDGGTKTDPCAANPNAQECTPNPPDPCAGGVSTTCCNAQPNYQGCPTTNPTTTTYTLTVNREPSNGGSTNPASSQANIQSGTAVNISATPNSDYTFTNWTVSSGTATFANANSAATTVTLTSNATIRANFTLKNITPPTVYTFTDDRDGTSYNWVQIGTQKWMAENLNYDAEGSKCYHSEPDSCAKYGRFYTWMRTMDIDASYRDIRWEGSDINHQGVCPVGWHIPGIAEWITLADYVGGASKAGTKLKSSTGWYSYNNIPAGTDEYGFSALPGGYFLGSSNYNVGENGRWWSATEESNIGARTINMSQNSEWVLGIGSVNTHAKVTLLSVRCVQN